MTMFGVLMVGFVFGVLFGAAMVVFADGGSPFRSGVIRGSTQPTYSPPPPPVNLPPSPLRECNVCRHMYRPGSART